MTLSSATEYFVSYMDCPENIEHCDIAIAAGHTCLERPSHCERRRLRYRCHLGNMTEGELADFRRESRIDNFPDYLLQSVNDLALESREMRKEHVRARENFENLPEWGYRQPETSMMRGFEFTANLVTKDRFGAVFVPYFVNSEVACIFYGMEMAIIEGAIRPKIRALEKESSKLCEGIIEPWELPDENSARLAKIKKVESELEAELKEKLQELRKLQEVGFTLIASPVLVDESMVVKKQKREPSQPKKQKPPGSGRKKTLDKRLSEFFDDLERRVYSKEAPLHPVIAYRYTKEKVADELKTKYPDAFKGTVGSLAKQIQTQPSWKKWTQTREKFIGENCDGLNQNDLRLEKFERVVYDFLAYVRDLKDRMREKKHAGTYEKEYDGLEDEEYLTLTKRITPKMAAQWAKRHQTDYIEIGEIFRWKMESLATEFAKTNEWINHVTNLSATHLGTLRRRG